MIVGDCTQISSLKLHDRLEYQTISGISRNKPRIYFYKAVILAVYFSNRSSPSARLD
jgi:hypothetical protein